MVQQQDFLDNYVHEMFASSGINSLSCRHNRSNTNHWHGMIRSSAITKNFQLVLTLAILSYRYLKHSIILKRSIFQCMKTYRQLKDSINVATAT